MENAPHLPDARWVVWTLGQGPTERHYGRVRWLRNGRCRGGHYSERTECETQVLVCQWNAHDQPARTDDAVIANQVRDNCAAVIVSTLEDGRIISANDRSSRLWGYNRDEVIRRTFLGLGLAASRKHREVPSAVVEFGVCRHEIVVAIRTRVGH